MLLDDTLDSGQSVDKKRYMFEWKVSVSDTDGDQRVSKL